MRFTKARSVPVSCIGRVYPFHTMHVMVGLVVTASLLRDDWRQKAVEHFHFWLCCCESSRVFLHSSATSVCFQRHFRLQDSEPVFTAIAKLPTINKVLRFHNDPVAALANG